MHGVSTSGTTDTFTVNGVGASNAVKPNGPNLFPAIRHLISSFTATSVVGSATLTYDVQMHDGIWVDSGTAPVTIPANGSGTIQGITNSGLIMAFRHRVSGMTSGTINVTSRSVDIA
jgi:hypothetical protein